MAKKLSLILMLNIKQRENPDAYLPMSAGNFLLITQDQFKLKQNTVVLSYSTDYQYEQEYAMLLTT